MKVPKEILVSPGWFDGGTLKDATVKEWHAAKWRDALATCSLWIRSAAVLHGQPVTDEPNQVYRSGIDFQQCDLLGYSATLLRAVTEGSQNYNEQSGDMRVFDLAMQALFQLGWLEIKDASVPEASSQFEHLNLEQETDQAVVDAELAQRFPEPEAT